MRVWSIAQERLQGLGRALMLPIAVLPVAGLLLRLGQPDLLDLPFMASAGQAIFAHLGLLFAIGVGVGLAKENNGAAGLAGAVAFVVLTEGAKVLIQVPDDVLRQFAADPATRDAMVAAWKDRELAKLGVPAGIICGLAAGSLYNRFHDIRFPEYLSFFGGRRFVPIASGLFGLVAALLFGLGFPALEAAVDGLSRGVTGAGNLGLFLYGALNRVLIVTGLHHILNNIAWFVVGDYQGATGDLNRFFAGDPTAGVFMTGFFPIMMFGLPAACLAMWRAARPDRRKAVGGMLLSMALTSFLTGVTEPIEFTFMFLAPALYALHAVLTGVAMVVMNLLEVKIGFGFSAGLFDYVLNYSQSTRPWLLLPVGLAYAAIYYAVFSFAIRRFNLATPGREPEAVDQAGAPPAPSPVDDVPAAYIAALGGPANLAEVGACTTRLRLTVHDRDRISEQAIRALGAKAVIPIGANGVQVVIGPESDRIAGAINRRLQQQGAVVSAAIAPPTDTRTAPGAGAAPPDHGVPLDPRLIAWLGGAANILHAHRKDRRTVVSVANPALVASGLAGLPDTFHGYQSRDGKYHLVETGPGETPAPPPA